MNEPKFSIIIPVYNVEALLPKCIDSVLSQTDADFEVILVDDGSTDKSPEICEKYALKDSRISVFHKKNGGLSSARNRGIEAAAGEYILFLDSDDYIEPDTVENFGKLTEEKPDVIAGDCIVENADYPVCHIDDDFKGTGKEFLKSSLQNKKMPMAAWLNVFKRDFLIRNELCFKEGIFHEDEEFTPRALFYAESMIYRHTVFYHYVIRKSSIMGNDAYKRKRFEDKCSICLELEKFFMGTNDETLKRLMMDYLTGLYLSSYYYDEGYKAGEKLRLKTFVKKYMYSLKTVVKGTMFLISPKVFCFAYRRFFSKK